MAGTDPPIGSAEHARDRLDPPHWVQQGEGLREMLAAMTSSLATASPSANSTPSPVSHRVFVVDSDGSSRRDAIQALLPHGFEIRVGEGPFEATTAILKSEPDLVILGNSMTHPLGLALIGRLFSLPSTADTPVIVIADTPDSRRAAEQAGATRVLAGPVTERELYDAVKAQLASGGSAPAGAPASLLGDEGRLAAVAALRRDASGNVDLDRFTKLTSDMLGAPVSMVTLIENDRQIHASQVGLPEPLAGRGHTSLEHSYCQYAITSRQPLLIDDATRHPLVADSPSVADDQWIAYAGIPLITTDGHAVGALCAIDRTPRNWTAHDLELLENLAGILTDQLDAALTTASAIGRHRVL
jgi:CheY-like chemotaxis protein